MIADNIVKNHIKINNKSYIIYAAEIRYFPRIPYQPEQYLFLFEISIIIDQTARQNDITIIPGEVLDL